MAGSGIRRTRFAPSPTGYLHLGHAYAAQIAMQQADPGQFLLRIEDIDRVRSRQQYEQAVYDDLRWLGIEWSGPVMRQSKRQPIYSAALQALSGLCYPCRCRRGDIRAALSAPQEGAPATGPDGLIYPGTCRNRPMSDARPDDAIRLNADLAFRALNIGKPEFSDEVIAPERPHILTHQAFLDEIGDVVLARRGMGTSYHLAVVLDDAEQGITVVTRGADLYQSTWIHVLLQKLLRLPTPLYYHHGLVRDQNGKRLAKRDDSRAIRHYRASGLSPAEVMALATSGATDAQPLLFSPRF